MATLQLKDIDLSLPYSRDGSMAGPVPFSAPPIRRSKQTEQPRSQEEGRKALVNTSKKASFRKSEPTTMTKYDQLRQAQQASNQQAAKQFIQRVLGRDALDDHVGFFEGLRDGIVLCRLVNAIQPNLIPTIGYKDLPFVKMENIANFLQGARALGLANSDLFQTVDLYEGKDLAVVVATLLTLERLVYGVPSPQLATHPPVVDSSSAAIDENASRPEENSVSSTDADRTRHSVSSLVLQSHPRSSLREAEDDDQLQDYIGGLGISTPKSPTFPSSPLPQRDVYSRSASALKAIESPSLPSRPIRSYLIATPPSPSLRTPSTSERTHRPNYGRSSSYDSQDTPNTLYTKARSDRYQEPSNMFSDVDTSGRLYPSGILSPGQSSLRRNSIPEEVNQHNSLPRDPLAASRSNLQKIKTFGRASVITANAASEGKQRRCNDGPPRPRTYLPLQSGRSFGNANTHEVTKPPISVATRPSPINNTKSTDAPNEGPLPQYQHVRDIYAQMDKELEERRLQRQNNGRTTSDLEERAGTWNTPSSASNRSSIRSNRLLGKATALQDLLRDSQDDSSAVQKENGRASLLDWASRPESDGENDDKSCAPVLVNRVQTSEDDAGKIDRKSATEDESIARSSISSIPTSIPSIPDSDEEEAGMAQSASLWTTLNHPSSNSRDSRQSSSGVFRKANDSGYGTSQRKPTQEIRVRLEEIEQSFKELGSADPSLRSPSWCLLDGSVDSLRSNTGLSTLASSDRTISVMNIPKSFGSISSRRNSIQEPYNTSMAPSNSQLKRLAISEAEKRSQASKSFLSISSGQSSIGKEDASKREILSLADDDDELIQYQLGNCIGKGQFGAVYRALNLNNGQMVAVKRIKKEDGLEEEMDNLMQEVALLKSLRHENVVTYFGSTVTDSHINIILEYVENGSLLHTLKSFGAFPEKLIASYVMRILDGLEYLHEEGVVHCDLKAANILTTKSGNVKLSDFGVSLNLKLREADTGVVAGTPNWMAPEVIELKGASTKSDIWSLGCTVIELFTGKPPYSNLIAMTTLFRIVEDERPPIPEKCSTDMRDFLIECFQKDPDQRPDAVDLKRHPWLVRHAAQKISRAQDAADIRRYKTSPELPSLRTAPSSPRAETSLSQLYHSRNRSEASLLTSIQNPLKSPRATTDLADHPVFPMPPRHSDLPPLSPGARLRTISLSPYYPAQSLSQSKTGSTSPRPSWIRRSMGSPTKETFSLDAGRTSFLGEANGRFSTTHRFVKTSFGKAVECKVCLQAVKKHAMFCEDCNLICHDKCKVHARECSANLTTAFTDNELLTTSVTHSPLLSQNTQQSPSTQSRSRSYSYVEPKVVTPPSPNPSVSSNMKDRARKISRVFSSVSPSSIQQHVMEGLKHRSPFHMENPSTTGSYDDRNSYFTPNNAPATPSNRHARSSRSLSINLGDHTSPRRSLAGTPSPFRPPTIDEDYFDTNVQKGKGNKEEDCAIS